MFTSIVGNIFYFKALCALRLEGRDACKEHKMIFFFCFQSAVSSVW
jgi:ribulose 1,5-bisphosphate carboxylase large subunit-like protein